MALDSRLVTRLRPPNSLPSAPCTYPAEAPTLRFKLLPCAYPALRFWLATPGWLPGSDLLTCYPAPRALTRLRRQPHYSFTLQVAPMRLPGSELLAPGSQLVTRLRDFGSRLPAGYPALRFWLSTPGWLPGSDLPTRYPAPRALTRLRRQPRRSFTLQLPLVGARLLLPAQPEGLWAQLCKQALRRVSKRSRPLHKLPRAYSGAHSPRWFCSTWNPPSSPHGKSHTLRRSHTLRNFHSLMHPPTTFYHESSIPRVLRRNCIDAGRFW